MVFTRPVYNLILSRVNEPRKFIQVIAGPRQVGKTTIIKQILNEIKISTHYASSAADSPTSELLAAKAVKLPILRSYVSSCGSVLF
ncbi:MAG: AAA family ATPase [Candidatus Berkiellales bacterium]